MKLCFIEVLYYAPIKRTFIYLGKLSLDLQTRVRQTAEIDLPYRELKVIFSSKCTLDTLFQFKDSLEKNSL